MRGCRSRSRCPARSCCTGSGARATRPAPTRTRSRCSPTPPRSGARRSRSSSRWAASTSRSTRRSSPLSSTRACAIGPSGSASAPSGCSPRGSTSSTRWSRASPACGSGSISAAATTPGCGWPAAATSSSPGRCSSARPPSTPTSSNTTTRARARSSRSPAPRTTSRSCSASSRRRSRDGETSEQLLARIEDAARFFPREQLGLSTQCGFASIAAGNPISEADEEQKLRLVAETARARRLAPAASGYLVAGGTSRARPVLRGRAVRRSSPLGRGRGRPAAGPRGPRATGPRGPRGAKSAQFARLSRASGRRARGVGCLTYRIGAPRQPTPSGTLRGVANHARRAASRARRHEVGRAGTSRPRPVDSPSLPSPASSDRGCGNHLVPSPQPNGRIGSLPSHASEAPYRRVNAASVAVSISITST